MACTWHQPDPQPNYTLFEVSMKSALCIAATDLRAAGVSDNKLPIPLIADTLSRLNTVGASAQFRERPACETQPEWVQVIPYITFVAYFDGVQHVLVYTRGKGSDEARLHSKLSIGYGGHIDTEWDPATTTLIDLVKSTAQREVYEELGLVLPKDVFTPTVVLHDHSDEVGKVHLGLATVLVLSEAAASRIAQPEPGIVDDVQWIPTGDLLKVGLDRFETWSVMMFGSSASWPQQ